MAEKLTPRKQQALEMRSRIQNMALDLFDREGFENVSVEEIAQKAGCSVGNIYHYFKSKDELAIQVTSHVDAAYLTLEAEYLRDKNAGLPIHVPENYYPDNDDTKPPVVSWRSHANLLYQNWLNYFVYQTTPYDLSAIRPV